MFKFSLFIFKIVPSAGYTQYNGMCCVMLTVAYFCAFQTNMPDCIKQALSDTLLSGTTNALHLPSNLLQIEHRTNVLSPTDSAIFQISHRGPLVLRGIKVKSGLEFTKKKRTTSRSGDCIYFCTYSPATLIPACN